MPATDSWQSLGSASPEVGSKVLIVVVGRQVCRDLLVYQQRCFGRPAARHILLCVAPACAPHSATCQPCAALAMVGRLVYYSLPIDPQRSLSKASLHHALHGAAAICALRRLITMHRQRRLAKGLCKTALQLGRNGKSSLVDTFMAVSVCWHQHGEA